MKYFMKSEESALSLVSVKMLDIAFDTVYFTWNIKTSELSYTFVSVGLYAQRVSENHSQTCP